MLRAATRGMIIRRFRWFSLAIAFSLLWVSPAIAERSSASPTIAERPTAAGWRTWERLRQGTKRVVARKVYRPVLDSFRTIATESGGLIRKYLTGRGFNRNGFRWNSVEGLQKHGELSGAFGHPIFPGDVKITSPLLKPEQQAKVIATQRKQIGRGQLELGPMAGISGMSYPQLSAPSILSLLYAHIKLQRAGVRQTFNVGEGGPGLHLALLSGDGAALEQLVLNHGYARGEIKPGGHTEAKTKVFINNLMAARNKLFAEFDAKDLARAQLVAQFGTGLNGIRGANNRIDWDKLKKIGDHPNVAMVQFKLKQAAKRGGRLDVQKLESISLALRDIGRDVDAKSPAIHPELGDWKSIARLVKRAREVTNKPVSLKMGIGNVADFHQFVAYLAKHAALPDHLQLDGAAQDYSPGSGNAPPGVDTSLPINEAIIVADAVLKKLGVREKVFVEASGGILLPQDGVEKLALGADGISAARLWMGMGLGCAKVKRCNSGSCPYGIASRGDSIFTYSLDPQKIAPKGFRAAKHWHESYVTALAETKAPDWRTFRKTHGLASADNNVRKHDGRGPIKLRSYYSLERVEDLLGTIMSTAEINRHVYGNARDL